MLLIRLWLILNDTLYKKKTHQETLPTHFSLFESHCVWGQQPKGNLSKKKKKFNYFKLIKCKIHNYYKWNILTLWCCLTIWDENRVDSAKMLRQHMIFKWHLIPRKKQILL